MNSCTFGLLTEQYFYSKSLRPATEWSYQKVVRSFEGFTSFNPTRIDHLTVLKWRHTVLNDQNCATRTWNNKVAHMRALFNFGIKQGLLPQAENPFNGAVVRPGTKKKKTLTQTQMDAMYRLMEQHLDAETGKGNSSMFNGRRNALLPAWFWLTVVNVFRYTAIRQNQLLHIRLGDINLDERWIDLNIEGAKNHREHRVPIVSSLYPSLEELVRKAGEAGMESGDQVFNVGWFDLMRKSKYPEVMNEYPLRAFFRRLSRECKFTITPHRFRHTVATHMMKSPERNLYAVKKLLGHVSITSTLEYIDESVDSLRDILETELM
ncbi:tyrosine-type recombinase/integrase [Citrobacter portucalensis]|uniref:tyrosine-type recombinase/integrase n=1 Tax=Citrobacter portucalensis TaxID=1639133 RepID=UPI00226B8EA9|nr:site-specific integrase [Citrobacter portucalensis]MCX9046281.1 site-specific integrase [Citrobacter portucalensis]